MKAPKLINIVSGKGGAGKSLLCVVLARMIAQENQKVLLVDLDLSSQGLSQFFYLSKDKETENNNPLSSVDFFREDRKTPGQYAFFRLYELDILPVSAEVNSHLSFKELTENSIIKTRGLLTWLKSQDYDYILIDNQAGIDNIVLETSAQTDITLAITESDNISLSANKNLLAHLSKHACQNAYTIINKAKYSNRGKHTLQALATIAEDSRSLGQIPFDVDLFDDFGKPNFWKRTNSTRYAYSLARLWNKLSQELSLNVTINMRRFSKTDLWPGGMNSPVFLNRLERISVILSILFFVSYSIFKATELDKLELSDFLLIYGIVMISMPVFRRIVLR